MVQMYGYPLPNITWSHDGVLIGGNSSMGISYITMEPYSGVSQVMISQVRLAHQGLYLLSARNTVHNETFSTSFSIEVFVNYKPKINLTNTIEVLEMTTEKIPCIATARPIASEVKWFFNRTDIATSPLLHSKYTLEDTIVDESGEIPVVLKTLIIKQARLQDTGPYTCQVTNLIQGQLQRTEATVTVLVGMYNPCYVFL